MVRLQRRPDWPERLNSFIDMRRHMPFMWGRNDCALFAADCIYALTGVDLAVEWRGYTSEREAFERISGVGGMRGFARELTERNVRFAQRGDVILAAIEGRETYGIVIGGGRWAAPGKLGIVFRTMADALTTFEY